MKMKFSRLFIHFSFLVQFNFIQFPNAFGHPLRERTEPLPSSPQSILRLGEFNGVFPESCM